LPLLVIQVSEGRGLGPRNGALWLTGPHVLCGQCSSCLRAGWGGADQAALKVLEDGICNLDPKGSLQPFAASGVLEAVGVCTDVGRSTLAPIQLDAAPSGETHNPPEL